MAMRILQITGLWLGLLLTIAAQEQIPQLNFDSFGPGIREQVQKANEEALRAPKDAGRVGKLCQVLHAYEEHESAKTCYQYALKLAPEEFQWLYLLGIEQAALGSSKEAIETLRKAIDRKPDFLPARLRLADLLLASGEFAESRKMYETISSKQPELAQAWYGWGSALVKLGEKTNAIERLQKAVALSPQYGAAHYALALAYRDLGEREKSAEHLRLYQQYRLIRPVLADPWMSAVAELNTGAAERLKRGVALAEDGQFAEAIREHERAIEINPQYAQARINLIQLYGRTKQTEKAEEQYRALLQLNPNLAEAHYNFGVLMNETGRLEQAAAAFDRSLEINPHFAEARLNLGAIAERGQKYDDAMEHYRLAAEARPNLREAHFQYARMLIFKGRLPEAIDELRQTIAIEDEGQPRYLYALGATYARAGDSIKALKYMRQARERAHALKQTALLGQIERDLKALEQRQ